MFFSWLIITSLNLGMPCKLCILEGNTHIIKLMLLTKVNIPARASPGPTWDSLCFSLMQLNPSTAQLTSTPPWTNFPKRNRYKTHLNGSQPGRLELRSKLHLHQFLWNTGATHGTTPPCPVSQDSASMSSPEPDEEDMRATHREPYHSQQWKREGLVPPWIPQHCSPAWTGREGEVCFQSGKHSSQSTQKSFNPLFWTSNCNSSYSKSSFPVEDHPRPSAPPCKCWA